MRNEISQPTMCRHGVPVSFDCEHCNDFVCKKEIENVEEQLDFKQPVVGAIVKHIVKLVENMYLGRIAKLEERVWDQSALQNQIDIINKKLDELDKGIDPFRNTQHENVWPSMRALHNRVEKLESAAISAKQNPAPDESQEIDIGMEFEGNYFRKNDKLIYRTIGGFEREATEEEIMQIIGIQKKKTNTYWVNVYKVISDTSLNGTIVCQGAFDSEEEAEEYLTKVPSRKYLKTISFTIDEVEG